MNRDNSSFQSRKSNGFNQKKQIMKTPHPKFYKKEDAEAEAETSSWVDGVNTTKDRTFISKDTAKTNEETERPGKFRRIFTKRNRYTLPQKIGDYFINFEEIRNKNKSKSCGASRNSSIKNAPIIVLNESIVESKRTVTRSVSSLRSPASHIFYSGAIRTESNVKGSQSQSTPIFGSCHSDEKGREEEVLHPKLPLSKKDDEVYKMHLVSNLKHKKMSTDTHKFIINRKRKCKFN
jgi:hypothetical protein